MGTGDMGTGIPPTDLSDEDLERELAHVHEKRHEILLDGTAEQWHNLRARTDELERGYVERFVTRVKDAEAKLAEQQ
jgi:uncharacterized protein DUF6158